jgi:hypothetical protein
MRHPRHGAAILGVLLLASGCTREPPAAPASGSGPPAVAGTAAGAPDPTAAAAALPAGTPGQELLAPIPSDRLPARTSPPPDPASDRYVRGKASVRIEEMLEPKDGPAFAPPTPILRLYLEKYLARAGWAPAADPAGADLRIEGSFRAKYAGSEVVLEKPIAHRYEGTISLAVLGKGGEDLDRVEVPDFPKVWILKDGEPEDERVILDLRRQLAKVVWEHLASGGKAFADAEVHGLLASLAADDSVREAPVQGDDVVKALAAKRLAAVPFLLDALTDERPVKVNAHYPGLTASNSERLRVYHIADKALEEIFQKVSRLALDTPAKGRFLVIRGWEKEWARFCPPFREALEAEARRAVARRGGAPAGEER